jgi:hypothetical protein
MCTRVWNRCSSRGYLIWRTSFGAAVPRRQDFACFSSTDKPDVRKLAEMARIEITDEQVCTAGDALEAQCSTCSEHLRFVDFLHLATTLAINRCLQLAVRERKALVREETLGFSLE